MTGARDTFCSYCGARFAEPLAYPRTCAACGVEIWSNPTPVCVALVPIVVGTRTGLLVVRRAIPPGIGALALVGGFLEDHETWQLGCAREVREETGIEIDPTRLVPSWYASTEPRPNRVLLFAVAADLAADQLPPLPANSEVSERGVVFGAGGLESVFAFSLHVEAVRRYFGSRGDQPHAFVRV